MSAQCHSSPLKAEGSRPTSANSHTTHALPLISARKWSFSPPHDPYLATIRVRTRIILYSYAEIVEAVNARACRRRPRNLVGPHSE